MVALNINKTNVVCFLDTGSQVTIIKPAVLQLIDPTDELKITPSCRLLRGVSGQPTKTLGEVDLIFTLGPGLQVQHQVAVCDLWFPGNLLLGMDFLRKVTYTLSSQAHSPSACLFIEGRRFPVTYAEGQSLQLAYVNADDPYVPAMPATDAEYPAPALSAADAECPPAPAVSAADAECPAPAMPAATDTAAYLDPITPTAISVSPDLCTPPTLGSLTNEHDWDALQVMSIQCLEREMEEDGFEFEDDLTHFDTIYGLGLWGDERGLTSLGFDLPPSFALAAIQGAEDLCLVEEDAEGGSTLNLDHLEQDQRERTSAVLDVYHLLFDGDEETVGHIPDIQHRIDTGNAAPVRKRQWRLPQATRAIIREKCDAMLRAGVIEPSTSPWLSPVVLVRKKSGDPRFCADFRDLNAVTKADAQPLPRIDELIDELGPSRIFTTLDARAAYWSIEIRPEDKQKTAFSDGYRLFHFKRLPFGLSTAPSTFQRAVNTILAPVLGRHTLAYLDDIIIHSRSFEQHLTDLEETLQLLLKAGFKLNPGKCTVAATTINFLGFTISQQGVTPDMNKVAAIVDTPAPRTVRQVRRFLGATNFFRRHIPGYAAIAAPLYLLLKKDQPWVWGDEQQEAFQTLKTLLASEPILQQPDFSKQFELHTDASQVAIGAALLQQDDQGVPHAVAFYSRKLRDAERRYTAIDSEALAVVEGVRVFDAYLYGRRFIIYTDHRPLIPVFQHRTKSPRMTRYAHDLSFYDFEIRYKEGPTNYVPDLLSRHVASVNINDINPQELAKLQGQDAKFEEILGYLLQGKVPKKKLPSALSDFEMKDGILYRVLHLPDQTVFQLCVPEGLRKSALLTAHTPPLAMHPGIQRTYGNLRNMFYWPNMMADVRRFVEACLPCQQNRGVAQRVPMADAPLAMYPLEKVSTTSTLLIVSVN